MTLVSPYLRPKHAAEFLGISQATFWRLVSSGKITTKKISQRVTICSVQDLEDYVNSSNGV